MANGLVNQLKELGVNEKTAKYALEVSTPRARFDIWPY